MTPSLFSVISQIESNNRLYAMRYEPLWGYFTMGDLQLIAAINQCDIETSRIIAKTSWGATQIMGSNLYDTSLCGINVPIGVFLNTYSYQLDAFNAFTQKRGIAYTVNDLVNSPSMRLKFAQIYNGNGPAYASAIVSALRYFGLNPVMSEE
jgi:hypothetical protein